MIQAIRMVIGVLARACALRTFFAGNVELFGIELFKPLGPRLYDLVHLHHAGFASVRVELGDPYLAAVCAPIDRGGEGKDAGSADQAHQETAAI